MTISATANVLWVRLTIEEIPTMSGRYEPRSSRSCSRVPNVQSNTLVSTPSRRNWPASVATPSGGKSSSVAALVRK